MQYLFSLQYLILQLFIAVPLFLVIQWALKNLIKTRWHRIGTTIGTTLILTPIICLLLIQLLLFAIQYEPSQSFDKSGWLMDKDDRLEMADNIVSSKILIGKDSNQVLETLGKPTLIGDQTQYWRYDMGMGRGGLGFMFHYLVVNFSKDTVVSVTHSRIPD